MVYILHKLNGICLYYRAHRLYICVYLRQRCVCTYVYVYIRPLDYTYAHVCAHSRMHTYMIHTPTHLYTHTRTHAHTYTHTHTYAHVIIIVIIHVRLFKGSVDFTNVGKRSGQRPFPEWSQGKFAAIPSTRIFISTAAPLN